MFKLKHYYERYYKHMSQQEFANLLGLSQSYVSQLLGGRRSPSAKILFQVSERLNVPVEKLFKIS